MVATRIGRIDRIGKLTLWHYIGRKHFGQIVVNLGRKAGIFKTLALVLPKMRNIGFIARLVRVPIITGSLIILVVVFRDEFTFLTRYCYYIYRSGM